MLDKIIEKWNELFFILMLSIFAIIFAFIYFGSEDSKNKSMYDGIKLSSLKSDWYVYGSSLDEGQIVFIPETFVVPVGQTVSIRKVCEDMTDGMALCFKTDHTSVRVLINNVEIYSYGWEDIPIGDSPGSKWHIIPMYSENSGKTMEIQFNSEYGRYSGLVPEIFIGYEGDVNLHVQKSTMTEYVIGYISLVLGCLLFISFFLVRRISSMKQLLYLGAYLIFNALWGMVESGYFQFLNGNDFGLYFMKCMLFAIVPVAMVMALKAVGIIKKHFTIVFGVVFTSAICIVLMQLFGVADFYETTHWVHIAVFIASVIVFIDNYIEYKEKQDKNFRLIFIAFVTLLSGVFLDLLDFYTFAMTCRGFLFRISSIIFVIMLGVWAVYQAMDLFAEGTKKEIFANMAYSDTLTGLYNRRAFDEDLRQIEYERMKVIIVMIDLNNLKTINDKLGHQSGDNAIKAISKRLKQFTEKAGERCYRTGGDEFCVICKKMNVNDIMNTCEGINVDLANSKEVPGATLSMAWGYKSYDPYMYDTIEQVVMKADEMMYAKKQKMKAEMAEKAAAQK